MFETLTREALALGTETMLRGGADPVTPLARGRPGRRARRALG